MTNKRIAIHNSVTNSGALTSLELKKASLLMLGILRSIHDLVIEIREDAMYFVDPDECVDEFDATLMRIAQSSEGIRYILDAHLGGTTKSGSSGLIARIAREHAKTTTKPGKRGSRNS